nr:ATP-binding cassette domain-containing protein [Nanchangia anserum]
MHDVSLTIPPGCITGFVGPNGAGKSTTLRLIAGLEKPQSGTALVDGRPMGEHPSPISALGCLLDAHWFLPARSGRDHLRALAAPQGISMKRVDYLLEVTELAGAGRMPVKTYSLGMRQRLGIAAALLGDARNYLLDEPANGLDPHGIAWLRHLLRSEAERGKSILLSSHLMAEMAQIADRVAVISHGVITDEAALSDFVTSTEASSVVVASDDPRLAGVIEALPGAQILGTDNGALVVAGTTDAEVGRAALAAGIVLRQLSSRPITLEDAYLARTESREARIRPTTQPPSPASPAPRRRYPSRKDRR